MKSPKPSPTVADVNACASEDPPPHPPRTPINSGGPSVANNVSSTNRIAANHHRSRNGSITVPLKTEHSPSEPFERQTVLMWGSTSNSNASSNRSPNNTPTSNTIYPDSMHPGTKTPMHLEEHHKWKGNHQHKETTAAAGIQVYQITHLPDTHSESYSSSAGSHLAQSPHHIGQQAGSAANHHHHHHHQHHHQQQSQQPHHHHGGADSANSIPTNHHPIGGGCEVWSPSYSQYQYFTYHHAPQHASTQWVYVL